MAHFAQLDANNIVTQVIVVSNKVLLDENGIEQEQIGIDFCKSLFGQDTIWKQASYNGNIRKNFAGIGFTYNETLDAFISPKPYDSWTLNEETCQWGAPVPMPEDEYVYEWNEEAASWQRVDINA